jgi:hypothetical protein
MVQIYTFFHITNCEAAAWVRRLSTIHMQCGEIDVDPRLILFAADVETCTPVWEVVDGYVIMSGSDGRPSQAHNPVPIVASFPRSGGHMSSVIIGLIFIVGGLSGQLALIGTNSGPALAVVGVLILGRGIYRIRKQRAQQQAQ